MKKKETILRRYVELSRAVTEADQGADIEAASAAGDRFWAFVEKYLYAIPMADIRRTDREYDLQFPAFC